jgi:hypothetical protein
VANALTSAPFPVRSPIVELSSGLASAPLIHWVTNLETLLNAAAPRLLTKTVSAQQASITPTVLPTAALSAGLYRVSVYARITQAATTSSSLTVTIGWTDSVPQSKSFPALTGNTTTTVLTDPPLLIRIDGNSPILYSATYASVGATPMQYRLDVVLERVDA